MIIVIVIDDILDINPDSLQLLILLDISRLPAFCTLAYFSAGTCVKVFLQKSALAGTAAMCLFLLGVGKLYEPACAYSYG